jgi:DNA-directed RNA polymerase specialized sigma24 family protein
VKDLNQLLESIEQFEPDSDDRQAALLRIHHNRGYFSTLLDSKADFLSLSRSIYRWYLEAHKRIRRGGKAPARMDPLQRPERSVSVPPLRMPTRQAYKIQSSIIARHISSLNKEIAKEPSTALPVGIPANDAVKSFPKGFEGLKTKADDFSKYYSLLTDKQQAVFSMSLEYKLEKREIAQRLGISRQMVDKHLTAAKTVIDNDKENQKERRGK